MKLIALYTKIKVLRMGDFKIGYCNYDRETTIVETKKPIEFYNEKPQGYYGTCPLYTEEQLIKNLSTVQGYRTEVVIKVVGEID